MSKRLLHPYSGLSDISGLVTLSPRTAKRPFLASDIRTIYGYPETPSRPVVVGVISLGGTLTGTIDRNGILTDGDVQAYWTSLGMTSLPTVKVVRVNGSAMDPTDTLSTIENTIDVEMVGACCPTSNLTIIFYFFNQYTTNIDAFYGVFSYAINTPVSIPGLGMLKPTIISCSWGAPESYFTPTELSRYNGLFAAAAATGITITTAAGDAGSSNGTGGTIADFPTSSPNVISCGGTHLICPNQDASGNYIYSGAIETTWSWSNQYKDGTGGGISTFFKGPPYPRTGTDARQVPDIALVADPDTGVQFTIRGRSQIIGGTSIVSPAIAGLAACLPKAPNGLLAKLYTLPSTAFNDITVGNNGAYFASAGFDNCTGLGSVNGAVFVPAYRASINAPVTSVTISGTLSALVGKTSQLTSSAASWWTSSNPAVATVVNGLVTGVRPGSATITVTTKDGFLTASSNFSVTSVVPESLRISTTPNGPAITSLQIRRMSSITLYASAPVTWSSSNANFVQVLNGVVKTGTRVGSAMITATSGTLRTSIIISIR